MLLFQWLQSLLSLAVLGGGLYALWEWYERARTYDPNLDRYVFDPDWGLNGQTALLALGLFLLLWTVAGRLLLLPLLGRIPRTDPDQGPDVAPVATRRLARPDGSELHVEFYGPEDAPQILLTHAWSLDSSEWRHLKRQLGDRFRLIAWDLPGLGRSTRAKNGDYSLENLADHLEAVRRLMDDRPVVLLGHSIGGMIVLTYCRQFPKTLDGDVSGLILTHTTYTNPLRTALLPGLFTALERPVIVPLSHLTIWLSPLLWVMNWMNYLNGNSHLSTRLTGFTGKGTWRQVELITRPQARPAPAVLARGTLGMLAYDATRTLPKLRTPVLVIAGDQDPLCKPEASEFITANAPAAELHTLSPARHMGAIEHHTRFAELVGEFVQRVR
jgi:pimeloyl-ACP methyl ester carboxylesterase